MNTNDLLPGIRRDLEFFPIQHEKERLLLVRDHLGLVPERSVLPIALYQLMTLLDGTTSLLDLQTLLIRQGGGELIRREEIEGLITRLDDSYLLDSQGFRNARGKIIADFAAKPVRMCAHAGSGYPAELDELGRRLDEILSSRSPSSDPVRNIRAIVSPHIDLSVGKNGYASAYQNLRNAAPSTVIVLGVGHRLAEGLFCLTEKDFQTPLGMVRSERSLVQRLRAGASEICPGDDFAHRSEHSIEFQILFLQHLLPKDSFSIVPILCGSMQSCVPDYRRSAYLKKSGSFLETLRGILAEHPEKTLLIAGVDLSHFGPKFGHDLDARSLEPLAREHDRSLLEALCRLDADRFWEESIKVRDRYNVCGFSALACLLEVLPGAEGKMLSYEVWHEAPTRSAVSFASMVFAEGKR